MHSSSRRPVADLCVPGSLMSPESAPLLATPVGDIMTPAPITAEAGASIAEATRLMLHHRVGGLPVVHRGRLVGIVTQADLVDRLVPRTRARWWMVLTDHERLARDCQRARGATVGEVMTRPVISVAPDDALRVAAELLRDHHIGRLPVADHGHLLGILSRSDLLHALAGAQRDGLVASAGRRGTAGAAPRVASRDGSPETRKNLVRRRHLDTGGNGEVGHG